MASSDIENLASDFDSNAHITPSSACAIRDAKPSVIRQERPPLEVSNSSNYFQSSSRVLNAATAKWTWLQKGGVFEGNILDSQHDFSLQASKELVTATIDEHHLTSGNDKLWEGQLNSDNSRRHMATDEQFVDDPFSVELPGIQSSSLRHIFSSSSKLATRDENSFGETYSDRDITQGLESCNLLGEFIDVDREAGFGEDEDFAGQDETSRSVLTDSTEVSHSEDEDLAHLEQLMQPRFSKDEHTQTNSSKLELRLGGRYNDHCSNVADNQVEEDSSQDLGDSTSMQQHATEQKWLTLSSSKQEDGLGYSHTDFWVEERSKEQFEDEAAVWKKKGRRMKHRMKGSHSSNDSPMQKNPDYVGHVMKDMLAELRVDGQRVSTDLGEEVGGKHLWPRLAHSENNGNSYRLMVMAFEELLREFEEKANNNRKKLDDVLRAKEEDAALMQRQCRAWFEKENQLRSRISSLELHHCRLSDLLRETAAALTSEKDKRKESRFELEAVMELLREEKKSHHETLENLNKYINSVKKLRESLGAQVSCSAKEGGSLCLESVESVMRDMDRELQWTSRSTPSKSKTCESALESSKVDELNRVKQQRDAAEKERDQIEERLNALLIETKEGHGEMEALWLEREKLMEQKVGCLEVELQYLHTKSRRKETEVMIERQRWADELENCMQAWARERKAWEATLKERVEVSGRFTAATDDGETLQSPDPCYTNMGNLVQVTGEVADIECEEEKVKERQREKAIEDWRQVAEQHKQERKETENKLSAALILVKNLEQNIKVQEAEMEEERNRMDSLMSKKSAELEKLKQSLKSKERDLEVTIQKFTDELKMIDKEVERERKEREQVMEIHFASKRQLVCDIKAKEESWEKTLEARNQELQMVVDQLTSKEKELGELHTKVDEEKSLRERIALELQREKSVNRKEMEEMLSDIWKICEDEGIHVAVAQKLLPGSDLSLRRPMWESLWHEYCRSRHISDDATVLPSTMEWEFTRVKVSRFEKQITDAMSAIKSLRDEVKAKEEQLSKVKADREREWEQREEDWAQEKGTLIHLLDSLQQKEVQLAEERHSREEEFAKKIEAMEELRKIEQEEAAEMIANLQGSTRELEWCLKRTNSLPSRRLSNPRNSSVLAGGLTYSPDKNEVVKVHSSYLEEVDRYIFDLESRKEIGDSSLRNSQTTEEGEVSENSKQDNDVHNGMRHTMDSALRTTSDAEGDFNPMLGLDEDGRLSPRVSREWTGIGGLATRGARQNVTRPLERGMCLTLNGLHTLTQENSWAEGGDGNLPLWQPDSIKRLGLSGSFNGSSSWISDDVHSYPGSPTRGCLALPGPSTPSRRPQKWLVDTSWLEQVRKEHAWLRQQLEIERQRVSALGRVEADNRWIEAAIIRALELKRQSDTKAAEMQRKNNHQMQPTALMTGMPSGTPSAK
ncbi:hypothetical protein MPTK1_3g19420 [Marchantia polymorpha subsp. ruderalis]